MSINRFTFEDAQRVTDEINDKVMRERGAAAERARIVAWLEDTGEDPLCTAYGLAKRIESGEHLK